MLHKTPQLPPFGKLLAVRLELSISLTVPVYVFVGTKCFELAKQEIANGGVALALPSLSDYNLYNWLANDLRFIVCTPDNIDFTELQIFAVHLLDQNAKHVLIHSSHVMASYT